MTSPAAKLGAIMAAAALIASAALPAYADLAPKTDSARLAGTAASTQSLSIESTVALAATSRDGYAVTAPPPPPPAPVVVAASTRSAAAHSASGSAGGRYSAAAITAPTQGYSGAAVLQYAAQFVGVVPYGSGNSPETSFSCDGYTQYVFAAFGISLPRTANAQARLGVRISQADAVAGDLVFWPGQHVGIYDGAGGMYNSPAPGRFVEHVGSLWGSPLFIRLTL